jgi:hypothetical protein
MTLLKEKIYLSIPYEVSSNTAFLSPSQTYFEIDNKVWVQVYQKINPVMISIREKL